MDSFLVILVCCFLAIMGVLIGYGAGKSGANVAFVGGCKDEKIVVVDNNVIQCRLLVLEGRGVQ